MSLSQAERAGARPWRSFALVGPAVLLALVVMLLSIPSGLGQPAAAESGHRAVAVADSHHSSGDIRTWSVRHARAAGGVLGRALAGSPSGHPNVHDEATAPTPGEGLVRTGSGSATQFSLVSAGALLLGLGFVTLAGRRRARARRGSRARR